MVKGGLSINWRGVGDLALLPGPPFTAPFADETPLAKYVSLHIEPVVAVHVSGGIDAAQGDGFHGRALSEI